MRDSKFMQKYLDEANFLGIAVKALSAAHQTILSDQTMRVSTHTTAKFKSNILESGYEIR